MTLQPHGQHTNPEQTAKIIWAALNGSLLMYGGMLIFTQKIFGVTFPGLALTQLQEMSLLSCLVFLVTFTIYRKKVLSPKPFAERFPFMITCWALNEVPALMAFAATFISSDGNGFFYIINAGLAILMNLVMFPRK